MKKWVMSVVVALIVVGSCVQAQPLVDRVPGDALIYVGWSGADSMGPGYAGSHLEAVLKDSKLSEVISEALPRVFKRIAQEEPGAAEQLAMFSAVSGAMWRHPSAFYFGGLDVSNPNGPPMPKVALLCDAGADGKALADQLRNIVAKAQPPVEIKVEEQGGMVVVSCGAKAWGAAQKPAAALSASATFKSALAQVQKDPVASVYVDMEGIVRLADQMLGGSPVAQNWTKARDALGLSGVKRLIWTAGFDGKDWMNQAFVDAPAPRKGMVPAMFNATPLSTEIVKTIPQSATVAVAGKFDLGGTVAAIRSAVTEIEPQAGQQIDMVLAQVRDTIGLDVQKDFLDLFGDEWAAYLDPMSAGDGLLGYTLVNRAKNSAKLETSLTRIEDLINGLIANNMGREKMTIEFKRTPVNGATLHHFAIPFISPAWAIKDGNLYVGLYPQVVEAALEQGGGKGKSILDNEDFLAVRKRLGNVPMSGMSFVNLPKTAPEGYQQLLMISRIYLGMADLFGADTPALALPPLRKIMPHLAPAGSVSWTDASGWHAKSVSPFPGSTMLTSGGGGQMLVAQQALMASIMLPSLSRGRETAQRVKCGSNMRQIGQGILLYANENKGKYPPNLGTLVKTEDLTTEVFVCPSGNNTAPRGLAIDDQVKWVNENADYVYVGAGMNSTAGPETIVLYEKPGAHGGQGMNMLYGDGHVEFQMMQSAMQEIQKQNANKKGGGR